MKIPSNSLNFFFFKYNKFVSHIQFCRDIMKTKLLFCINIHWDGITMICADNLSNTGQGLQHHRLQKPVSFRNKTSWDNTEHIGPPISLTIQQQTTQSRRISSSAYIYCRLQHIHIIQCYYQQSIMFHRPSL